MNPSRLVILGDPVSQSLSPKLQNAALRAAGIDVTYEALQVRASDLAHTATELAAEGAGGNVTVPHKKTFLSLCADLSPIASRVGAVNTFWTSKGKLSGDNTDVGGFDAAARELLGEIPRNITVAVVGAGGAAAAVLGAIEGWGSAKVRLYSRRADPALQLAARFSDFVRVESSASDAIREANLVVNATPVGMTGDAIPFGLDDISQGAALFDLVYRVGGTPLVKAASASGFSAIDGTEMLIEQGALAFERWFGFRARQEGDVRRAPVSLANISSTARRAALDFAFPRVCVSCERLMSPIEAGIVCGLCWSRLPLLPHPLCVRCGHPSSSVTCRWCDLLPPYVRAVRSVCWMPVEPAAQIVHALKYGGWYAVAREMAARMARLSWPEDVVAERTALVPVPLSPAREKERGYNQSAVIAAALGERWRVPVWDNCIERIRATRSQTELSPEERHANVAGSVRFHSHRGADLSGPTSSSSMTWSPPRRH